MGFRSICRQKTERDGKMKRMTAILTACLLLLLAACGGNTPQEVEDKADDLTEEVETTDGTGESADQYTEEETAAAQLLSGISGTYQELFPVL